MSFEFNPFTGLLDVVRTEFVNKITFKSTATDAFKVIHQFSTTQPTQTVFSQLNNNPSYFIVLPDGKENTSGIDSEAGGSASDMFIICGSGGNTTNVDALGGNAGSVQIYLGDPGVGPGGNGNPGSFIVCDSFGAPLFEVNAIGNNQGNMTLYGNFSVIGSISLQGFPSITVQSPGNNAPVEAFAVTTISDLGDTVAGFGGYWSFISRVGNSIATIGTIECTAISTNPIHARMKLHTKISQGLVEGFRFESDGTTSQVAICAIGGAVATNTKLLLYTSKAAYVGLGIRATASQTADLQQWQDSSGVTQLAIAANGRDFILNTTTGTKIGTSTTQKLGFWNATPVVQNTGWSATNVTTDRVFDASATTLAEIANVLGTLVNQLKTYGILG